MSNGQDTTLPMPGARVPSLVGELRSHMSQQRLGAVKQIIKIKQILKILLGVSVIFCREIEPIYGIYYICTHMCMHAEFLSNVRLFVTPWTAAHQASLSMTNSWSLLKLMYIKSVMPSNCLILCCPLLPPLIFPSITVFFSESVLHIRWPKYWSFNFSISPSNEYSGVISFRIDWFDLLAVQETLKSLLQHHNPKESILQHSPFFPWCLRG